MKLRVKKSIIMSLEKFEEQGGKPVPDAETIVIANKPTGVPGVLTALDKKSALALARYEVEIVE